MAGARANNRPHAPIVTTGPNRSSATIGFVKFSHDSADTQRADVLGRGNGVLLLHSHRRGADVHAFAPVARAPARMAGLYECGQNGPAI